MRTGPRLAIVLVAAALAAVGCGDGEDEAEHPAGHTGTATTSETAPSAEPGATENAAPPATSAQGRKGRQLVAQTGCFACHRIGDSGNDGPGPELSSVGERLPSPIIARALVDATPPMPSFASLPEKDRAAIVAYLVTLRGPDRNNDVVGSNVRER